MKNKWLSRVLAIALSAFVAGTCVPAAASAEGRAADVKVYMTVSDQGQIAADKDGSPMAWREVTASDLNEDGLVTFAEALTAAHEEYCTDGAAGLDITSSGWVTKVWGKENPASYSFIRNNVAERDLVTDVVLTEGDYLTASINKDAERYADWNSYFNKFSLTAQAGKPVSLTLSGYQAMTVNKPAAAAGISVGIWQNGAFSELTKTDEAGKASLTFDKTGTYIVTAQGAAADMIDGVSSYLLMETTKDAADRPIYGKMDWATYTSFVGYTEKDYGEGPYPWDEIKWIDLEDYNDMTEGGKAFEDGYLLYSGNVLADCPLIAPVCIVTVKAVNPLKVSFTAKKTYKAAKLAKKKQVFASVKVTKKGKGTLVYTGKAIGSKAKKALTFNKKNGRITVRKGTKKGTYKMTVTVRARGTGTYMASKTFKKTVKVVVR